MELEEFNIVDTSNEIYKIFIYRKIINLKKLLVSLDSDVSSVNSVVEPPSVVLSVKSVSVQQKIM